jgi:hypothetical protein
MLKNRRGWKFFFEKLSQFSQGNHVLVATASKRHVCLSRDTCVSSTELIRPIWNKMSLFHVKNYELQEVFVSRTIPVLTGNPCARCCSFYHRYISLQRYMCFFYLGGETYLEQREGFSTLKNRSCWTYSFQKLSQFSQGIHVLDTTSSKRNVFNY